MLSIVRQAHDGKSDRLKTQPVQASASLANVEITEALKLALKRQGFTYRQVADALGMSEKTIKRLFKDQDCSLSRLNDICQVIGINVYDLMTFAQHRPEPIATLTTQQERFLSQHPHHFSFLYFLIVGFDLNDIRHQYHLTELSVFRYLRDLDREGFLELGVHQEFRLKVEGKLLMTLKGPLKETVRRRNEWFMNYVMQNDGKGLNEFNSSFRFMSRQSAQDLKLEMADLMRRYRKLAFQSEQVLPKEKLVPVKWSTMVGEYSICGQWPLIELES